MDVGGAQFNGILKDLVDEANDRRFIFGSGVEVGILGVFIDDLNRFLLVECADGVGSDSEVFLHFPQERLARRQNQFETKAGQ